ncbi:MAG: tRNA pseudouridine(55) synthase TruB [Cyclobacteriaceae bacterium]|nr:tRNA pseudouridine(55) synthase TruB [Cyclobacteriaceae bacterium]
MQAHLEKYAEGEMILIDKSYQWTSFDVIKKIRNTIGIKKVGHAGTLDPLATGLLIICTGKMTKRIQEFQDMPKEYRGAFFLGATRPSFDKETPIGETSNIQDITQEAILQAAGSFAGEIDQVPPVYSAIRKEGKRSYEFAREGREIELESRKVRIFKFEITRIDLPLVDFILVCSKGFYVRSLARDFGWKLGCGAYLDELRRTAIGEHRVDSAMTIDEFVSSVKT